MKASSRSIVALSIAAAAFAVTLALPRVASAAFTGGACLTGTECTNGLVCSNPAGGATAVCLQACGASLKELDGTGANLSSTAAPPTVYVTGSTAVQPIVSALGPDVSADPAKPFTIVYLPQGSCHGPDSILNGALLPTATPAFYWDKNSNTAAAGTTTAKQESCVIPAGTAADLGASDVFADTCGYALQGIPSGFFDFQGPIQSMTIAVPKGSSQSSISAEAAYLTFGFANVAPWTDQSFIFRRNISSGTQTMIAKALTLDPNRWTGGDAGGSNQVYADLTKSVAQADLDKSIGILVAGDSAKDGIKQLAYQHFGQRCGYKPDIQPLDKRNTREGRYAIWGPIHLFAVVDPMTKLAQRAEVRQLISYLQGVTPPPLGLDLIRTEVQSHVVPPCAMKVSRTSEMGPMSPFKPTVACGCAFDTDALGSPPAGCKACTDNNGCDPTQSCNFGFCEAQ